MQWTLDTAEEQKETNARLKRSLWCFPLMIEKGNYDLLGQHIACKHTPF